MAPGGGSTHRSTGRSATTNCFSPPTHARDVWRTIHDGYLPNDGYFHPRNATGEAQIDVRAGGEDAVRYDPAGLMLWIDERNRIECGIEFVRSGGLPRYGWLFHRWRRCGPGRRVPRPVREGSPRALAAGGCEQESGQRPAARAGHRG